MEIILSIIVFSLVFFGCAIGFIFAGKALKGSCGGLKAIMGACDVCENRDECEERKRQAKTSNLPMFE